jgi:hypothetical protein
MKNLKSVSVLAAALLSTTAFAGGLGLGVGANINAGAGVGVGGLGLQSGVSQQTDAQVNTGSVRTDAQQSASVQSDVGVNSRTLTNVLPSASTTATANAQSRNTQRSAATEAQSDRRGVSGSINSDVAADVGYGAKQMGHGAHDAALTARQSAQLQRVRAHERLVQSGAGVSGSVRASEQLHAAKSGARLPKATVKQSAELYTGG